MNDKPEEQAGRPSSHSRNPRMNGAKQSQPGAPHTHKQVDAHADPDLNGGSVQGDRGGKRKNPNEKARVSLNPAVGGPVSKKAKVGSKNANHKERPRQDAMTRCSSSTPSSDKRPLQVNKQPNSSTRSDDAPRRSNGNHDRARQNATPRGSSSTPSSDKRPLQVNKQPNYSCLLYTSPSPRDRTRSRMPSSA